MKTQNFEKCIILQMRFLRYSTIKCYFCYELPCLLSDLIILFSNLVLRLAASPLSCGFPWSCHSCQHFRIYISWSSVLVIGSFCIFSMYLCRAFFRGLSSLLFLDFCSTPGEISPSACVLDLLATGFPPATSC